MSIKQDHIGDANKMVSSIEFLVKEINQIIDFIPMNKWDEIRVVVQQAKAMHKEECIKYYVDGVDYGDMGQHIRESLIQIAEKIYNKTFGQENEKI